MTLPSLLEQLGQRSLRYIMRPSRPFEMFHEDNIASADNIARDEVDNMVDSLNLGL